MAWQQGVASACSPPAPPDLGSCAGRQPAAAQPRSVPATARVPALGRSRVRGRSRASRAGAVQAIYGGGGIGSRTAACGGGRAGRKARDARAVHVQHGIARMALAALSAREELSDQHDTTALENLNWRARSREAAFMDCVWGECVRRARAATVALPRTSRLCGVGQPISGLRSHTNIEVDPNGTRSGPASWAGRPKWIRSRSEVDRFGFVSAHFWARYASVNASTHFGPLQSPTYLPRQ